MTRQPGELGVFGSSSTAASLSALPTASGQVPRVSAQVEAAAQADLAAGRLPLTPGSLSDMELAREGLPSAGQYTQAQLGQSGIPSGGGGTVGYSPYPTVSGGAASTEISAPETISSPPVIEAAKSSALTPRFDIGPIEGPPGPGFPIEFPIPLPVGGIGPGGAPGIALPVWELPVGNIGVIGVFGNTSTQIFRDNPLLASILAFCPFDGTACTQIQFPTQGPFPGQNSTLGDLIDKIVKDGLKLAVSELGGVIAGLITQTSAPGSSQLGGVGITLAPTINITNDITGAITSALGGFSTAISGALGSVFASTFNPIGATFSVIKDILLAISNDIRDKLASLINAIRENGASAIIPILNLILTEWRNIYAIIKLIESDIHGNIASIATSAGTIATEIGSLDAALSRAIQQMSGPPGVATNSTIHPGMNFLADLLPAETLGVITDVAEAAGVGEALGVLIGFFLDCNTTKDEVLSKLKGQLFSAMPSWVQSALQWITGTIIFLMAQADVIEKMIEKAREDANKKCPLEKLPLNLLAEAEARGLLGAVEPKEDYSAQGFTDARYAVFRELGVSRLPLESVLELYRRGGLDDATVIPFLKLLGFRSDSITALTALTQPLPEITDVLRWANYSLISDGDIKQFLKQRKIPDAQIERIVETFRTKETADQFAALDGRLAAYDQTNVIPSLKIPTPPQLVDAAKREGMTDGNARLKWLAHWNIPNYQLIMQSWFRHLRIEADVNRALQDANVPPEFWDELKQIARPLIPFRSIPSFIKDGIMSDSDATLELQAHGFDPIRIAWILQAAHAVKAKATPATSAGVAKLSLATARQFFEAGSITEDQYIEILVEHGYAQDLARSVADAELLAAHARQRRQGLTDAQNEVLAGVITMDAAIQTLTLAGYTAAEIARFQTTVRKQLRLTAPQPTMADMKRWIKLGFVNADAYIAFLTAQGWQDPYLGYFAMEEFPEVSTPTPPIPPPIPIGKVT